jgi:hypothetical protein
MGLQNYNFNIIIIVNKKFSIDSGLLPTIYVDKEPSYINAWNIKVAYKI